MRLSRLIIMELCLALSLNAMAEEAWVLVKSASDLPSPQQLKEDNTIEEPTVVIVGAGITEAFTTEPATKPYFFGKDVTFSQNGDTISGVTDDMKLILTWSSTENSDYVIHTINSESEFMNIITTDLEFNSDLRVSWEFQFIDGTSTCNIVARDIISGVLYKSYPYLFYSQRELKYTNNSKPETPDQAGYAMRIYVKREVQKAPEPPIAPEFFIEDFGQMFDGQSVDLSTKNGPVTVTLKPAEGTEAFYSFTPEADEDVDETFQPYTVEFEISEAGTIRFYALDSEMGLKSNVQTISFVGKIPVAEPEPPVAPEISIEGEDQLVSGQTVDLSKKTGPVSVSLTASEGCEIYYRLIAEETEKAETTADEGDETAASDPEFQLYTSPIEVATPGLLDFYAEDPTTSLRSEMQTVYFIGSPTPTGLTSVGVETEEGARSFDMLGRPVRNGTSIPGVRIVKTSSGILKILK